jgi:hypothetical protein
MKILFSDKFYKSNYVDTVKSNGPLHDMAMLAAGAAITAADIAMTGEPAFACLRPPGHHASRESSWGYWYRPAATKETGQDRIGACDLQVNRPSLVI